MISAGRASLLTASSFGFSAIARSVMISAETFFFFVPNRLVCFSAIARSVMISAIGSSALSSYFNVSVL